MTGAEEPFGELIRQPRRSWLVVAGGTTAAAEELARSLPGEAFVLGGDEVKGSPLRLRRAALARRADAVVLHVPSWERQLNPQAYELALALAPTSARYLAEASSGRVRLLGRGDAAASTARLPFDLAAALTGTLREGLSFRRRGRTGHTARAPARAVLAVWLNDPGTTVGGSVTHISGILGGFRAAGYRVGLLALDPPPPQLARVVDVVELAATVPPYGRVTSDVECIVVNGTLRAAGRRLADRLRPSFVYARHRAFLVAGLDVAREAGVPFVLEWNASEAWTRANWSQVQRLELVFDRLLEAMERHVAEQAELCVAVSEPAAAGARAVGARPERVVVVPNAVDLDEVDAAVGAAHTAAAGAARRVGWIGSFGPWHGAEVLVQALPLLQGDVELLMIGDGGGRPECEQLASTLGVADRIRWTGTIARDDALRLLAGCDVLASPHVPLPDQEFFGSPTKLFEYMALGRPIVASDLAQIGEVLQDGVTACLVRPGDPVELARGIANVLARPDAGASLGTRARAEAAARHTWSQRAGVVLETLQARGLLPASQP